MRSGVVVVGAVLLLALASERAGAAGGERRVQIVDATGDTSTCPERVAVVAALPAGRVSDAAPVQVEIARGDRGVRVRFFQTRAEDGAPPPGLLGERFVEGTSCAALGVAVAAVIEAWLLDLEPWPVPAPELPPEGPMPPRAPKALPADDAAEPAGPPRVIIALPAAPARFALGVGLAVAADSGSDMATATQWDAAYTLRAGWRLRARLDLGGERTLDPAAGAARAGATRTPWALAGQLAWRRGQGALWWQPALGAAFVVSRVSAAGLADGTDVLRLHPAAAAGLGGGLRLGQGVSLRLETTLLVFPVTDRYLMAPDVVGRSPRASISFGIGLDVALGSPKD